MNIADCHERLHRPRNDKNERMQEKNYGFDRCSI